jgi:hypothetical protein
MQKSCLYSYMIIGIVLLTQICLPAVKAQSAAGAYLAIQMDNSEDFISIGFDGVFSIGTFPALLNPGFTIFFQEDITEYQFDANLTHRLSLEGSSKFVPFFSGGFAINYFSHDEFSETSLGLNVGAGTEYKTSGKITPFVMGQYTMIKDQINRFLFKLGARMSFGSG